MRARTCCARSVRAIRGVAEPLHATTTCCCCACIPNNLRARLPTTLLFSSAVLPRPPDWGPHACVAGFVSLDDAVQRFAVSSSSNSGNLSDGSGSSSCCSDDDGAGTPPEPAGVCGGAGAAPLRTSAVSAAAAAAAAGGGYSPPPALAALLSPGAGPPPIYVGFGSVCMTVQLLQLVFDAAGEQLAAGQRLLVAGWSGDGSDALAAAAAAQATADGRVMVISAAPHDWLFARCAAAGKSLQSKQLAWHSTCARLAGGCCSSSPAVQCGRATQLLLPGA